MAAADVPVPQEKSLEEAVEELALYPIDAFQFIEEGIAFAVNEVQRSKEQAGERPSSRHITGQEFCEGLRKYALQQWGLMAETVLRRWNITCTYDFGRIVYALIDAGRMSKTDDDNVEHFRDVYDFKHAFEAGYRIESKP